MKIAGVAHPGKTYGKAMFGPVLGTRAEIVSLPMPGDAGCLDVVDEVLDLAAQVAEPEREPCVAGQRAEPFEGWAGPARAPARVLERDALVARLAAAVKVPRGA